MAAAAGPKVGGVAGSTGSRICRAKWQMREIGRSEDARASSAKFFGLWERIRRNVQIGTFILGSRDRAGFQNEYKARLMKAISFDCITNNYV